jgi:hypothetical protein
VRRLLATFALVAAWGAASWAADEPKDTAKAAATRKAVNNTKMSVDWKDTLMQDVAKELQEKLADAGVNTTVKVDSIVSGLTQNMKITLSEKNKTIAQVLDAMGKKYALGYVIISGPVYKKKIKKADGFLLITKGSERGYPAKD